MTYDTSPSNKAECQASQIIQFGILKVRPSSSRTALTSPGDRPSRKFVARFTCLLSKPFRSESSPPIPTHTLVVQAESVVDTDQFRGRNEVAKL